MEYSEICKRLKGLIPRFHSNLSEQETITSIGCVNGLVTITTPYSFSNNESITIVGSTVNYEDNGISEEYVNYNHIINSAKQYTIERTFINFTSSNPCFLHYDIRITLASSEEKAFNIFKQKPKDHIFIIPNGSNNAINTSDYNNNSDYLELDNNFSILVYLYDKNDLSQQNNLIEASTIMQNVISILHNHKPSLRSETIKFNKSEFVFTTENSTVLKGDFNFKTVIDEIIKTDFGYRMNLNNANLDTNELEKD